MTGLAQPISLSPRDNVGGPPSDTELSNRSTAREAHGMGEVAPNKVIGVVCAGDCAVHRDEVKTAIERGLTQRPDAVWVCLEPKSDHMTHDVMIALDISPVVLPLCPAWKRMRPGSWHSVWQGDNPDAWPKPVVAYDYRRTWRDMEMLQLCDELIVFHKRTSHSPWREFAKAKQELGIHRGLFIVELGPEPKKKQTKGRKPTGA